MAAPSYIDDAYVEAVIGSGRLSALQSNATSRAQVYRQATGLVRAAIKNAGYTPPTEAELASANLDDDRDIIKTAVLGLALPILFGAKGQEVPREFGVTIALAARFITGEIPFIGLAPNAGQGVGGAKSLAASADDPNPDPVFADLGRDW